MQRRSPRRRVIVDGIHDVDAALRGAHAGVDGLPDIVNVAARGVSPAPAAKLAGALRALRHGIQCATAGTVDPCTAWTRCAGVRSIAAKC